MRSFVATFLMVSLLTFFPVWNEARAQFPCDATCDADCQSDSGVILPGDSIVAGESCADLCGAVTGTCFDNCEDAQDRYADYQSCVATGVDPCENASSELSTCITGCVLLEGAAMTACHGGCEATWASCGVSDNCSTTTSESVAAGEDPDFPGGVDIDYLSCDSGCYQDIVDHVDASNNGLYGADCDEGYDGGSDTACDADDDCTNGGSNVAATASCSNAALAPIISALDAIDSAGLGTVKFTTKIKIKISWKGIKIRFKCEYYDILDRLRAAVELMCAMADVATATMTPAFSMLDQAGILSDLSDLNNVMSGDFTAATLESSVRGATNPTDGQAIFDAAMAATDAQLSTIFTSLLTHLEDIEDDLSSEPDKVKYRKRPCHM